MQLSCRLTEDWHLRTTSIGYEYSTYVRAVPCSCLDGIVSLCKPSLRGAGTWHNSTDADPSCYVEFTQIHIHMCMHTDVYNIYVCVCTHVHMCAHTRQEA